MPSAPTKPTPDRTATADRAAPAGAQPTPPIKDPRIALRVQTAAGIPQRRRAGFQFGSKAITVYVSPDQAKAIRGDDGLVAMAIGDGGDVEMSDELAHAVAEADKYKGIATRLRRHLDGAIAQMNAAGLEYTPPPADDGAEFDLSDVDDFDAPGGDELAAPRGQRQPREGSARGEGRLPLG